MGEISIILLCQILSNLTHTRCYFVENSHICRCVGDVNNQISPTVVASKPPNIMLSEVFLIFLVLAIWLSTIGFCLNQYKSLRRLETQVHYCVNRKDPLNIGDIKIVTREQDSIIYKKARYSTLLPTHINNQELKTIHYVQQYVPKPPIKTMQSALSALVISRDDLTATIPLSTTMEFNSSMTNPLNRYNEVTEYQSSISNVNMEIAADRKTSHILRADSLQYAPGLKVPHIAVRNGLHSSWDTSNMYDTSRSTQHLCVPSSSLRSNRYSDGNISLPVPQMGQKNPPNTDEQLLDPRQIPMTVRRSLLALHRESQENVNMLRRKHQTQSENDVYGSFSSWKLKMKSKLKRTHPHLQQLSRPHSNTVSIVSLKHNTKELLDRRLLENVTSYNEYPYSTPPPQPSQIHTRTRSSLLRRSLKHYPKYSTQSTSESETTQADMQIITSFYVPTNDGKSAETILETTERSP